MNYKLNASAGNNFDTVSEKAKQIATEKCVTVEFEFNGVICLVNKETNLEWLYRDYCNSWLMDWKLVGPRCLKEYEPSIQKEFEKRKKARAEKQAIEDAENRAKEEKEKKEFEEKVKGVEVEIIDIDAYNDWKSKNTDGYGVCIFKYAEGWAKLMQVEIANGKKLTECAELTSFQLGFLGITGFMYGAAVAILSKCWKHGEDLRKWHNKEYNHEGDGVVNPAILSVGSNAV
jgi:hypothetical protein